MAYRQARGAARESAVGYERALLAEVLRLDVAGGVEHLLHSGTSLGAFVSDDYHIAAHYLVAEYSVHSLFLRLEHLCRAAEVEYALINAGGLYNASVGGYVSSQHCKAAVLYVGVVEVAYAASGAVGVKLRIGAVL